MVGKRKLALKPVVMLIALFALGAVTGVCGTFAFLRDRDARAFRSGPAGFEEHRIKGLSRRLDLDDTQRAQVKALLRKNREEMRELGKKVEGECGQPMQKHREAFEAEMKKILRPDQISRYEDLQKERRAMGGPEGMPPPFP